MVLEYKSRFGKKMEFSVEYYGMYYKSECGKIFDVGRSDEVFLVGSDQYFSTRKQWQKGTDQFFDTAVYLGHL